MYWPLRLVLGIKGKRSRKKMQPTHWPAEIVDENGSERIQVEVGKLPRVYNVVEMPPAGIILGEAVRETNPDLKLHLKGKQADIKQFADLVGAGKVKIGSHWDWNAFNKTLAKIAHAYTVGVIGIHGSEFLLPALILGSYHHFPYLIGGIESESDVLKPPIDLQLEVRKIRGTSYVIVKVSLFSGRFPTYQIVSAEVRDLGWVTGKMNSFNASNTHSASR